VTPPKPADYPGCPVTVILAEESGRPLRSPRWGLWDAWIMLGGAIALVALVTLVLSAVDAPLAVLLLVGTLVPWLALAGWPLLATRWRGNGPVIDLGIRLTWRDVGLGLVGGVISLAVAAALAGLSTLLFGEFTSSAGDVAAELTEAAGRPVVVLFAFMLAFGAPVVEELAFRGLIFAGLRKHGFGPVVTITLSALVFALFHLEPARILVVGGVGLVLGVLRWRTGSLGAGIVAHCVNNLPAAVLVAAGLAG
jgi:membrane protease YdiL (CAAX protease family)